MARKQTHVNLKASLVKILRSLITTEGLDGLDVRRIIKEAHCSIGTFYNHFKSLDDLVVYFNGETLDLLSVYMFEHITPKDSPKDVINKICKNYIRFAQENHTEWILLLEYPLKIEIPAWYKDKSENLFKKVSNLFHPMLKGSKKRLKNLLRYYGVLCMASAVWRLKKAAL